jgi:hypothetical protein
MPLVTTAEMVGATHRDGCGITAYNVIKLEHAEAIVAAADRIDFHRGQVEPILAAVRAVAAQADVPVGTRSGSARLPSRRHRRSNVQRSSSPRTSSKDVLREAFAPQPMNLQIRAQAASVRPPQEVPYQAACSCSQVDPGIDARGRGPRCWVDMTTGPPRGAPVAPSSGSPRRCR